MWGSNPTHTQLSSWDETLVKLFNSSELQGQVHLLKGQLIPSPPQRSVCRLLQTAITEHVTRCLAHSRKPKQCGLSLISPNIGHTGGLAKQTPSHKGAGVITHRLSGACNSDVTNGTFARLSSLCLKRTRSEFRPTRIRLSTVSLLPPTADGPP